MKWITRLLSAAVFIVSVALVMIGQRMIGPAGLSMLHLYLRFIKAAATATEKTTAIMHLFPIIN